MTEQTKSNNFSRFSWGLAIWITSWSLLYMFVSWFATTHEPGEPVGGPPDIIAGLLFAIGIGGVVQVIAGIRGWVKERHAKGQLPHSGNVPVV